MYALIINFFIAILWIVSGLCFLRAPAVSARHLGYHELGPDALVDVRASFGGVCLATGLGSIGLSLVGCLDKALWLQIILLSGYAGGRAIGLFLKTAGPSPHRYWLAAEIALLILAISALVLSRGGLS